MKTIKLFLIFFAFIIISCEKKELTDYDEPIVITKPAPPIEIFNYNSSGVVFLIWHDVDSGFNGTTNKYEHIDSICLSKFHYYEFPVNISNLSDSLKYTWFTKKGDYVCWEYNFWGGIEHPYYDPTTSDTTWSWMFRNLKIRSIAFPNSLNGYSCYVGSVICDSIRSDTTHIRFFPKPINDTVYVNLSYLWKNYLKKAQ